MEYVNLENSLTKYNNMYYQLQKASCQIELSESQTKLVIQILSYYKDELNAQAEQDKSKHAHILDEMKELETEYKGLEVEHQVYLSK